MKIKVKLKYRERPSGVSGTEEITLTKESIENWCKKMMLDNFGWDHLDVNWEQSEISVEV